MKLKIKKFDQLNNNELYEILKSRIDIFVVEQNCPYHECDNLDQKSIHFYYQKENEIIAYLRVIPFDNSFKTVSIGRVMVKKNNRRKGIASKLIKEAIYYLDNYLETNLIKISAQEYVLDLYKKFGFKVSSKKYLEDGIPHYDMFHKL